MDLGQASVIVGLIAGLFAIGSAFKPIIIRFTNKWLRKKYSDRSSKSYKSRKYKNYKRK